MRASKGGLPLVVSLYAPEYVCCGAAIHRYRDHRCSSSVRSTVGYRHFMCDFLRFRSDPSASAVLYAHKRYCWGPGRVHTPSTQSITELSVHHAHRHHGVTCPPSRACRPRARYPLPALQWAGPLRPAHDTEVFEFTSLCMPRCQAWTCYKLDSRLRACPQGGCPREGARSRGKIMARHHLRQAALMVMTPARIEQARRRAGAASVCQPRRPKSWPASLVGARGQESVTF